MGNIAIRLHLADPSHNVDIIWGKPELPCLGKISRGQREADGEREAEPEIGRGEQEVVVAKDWSDKPSRRDCRVHGLCICKTFSFLYIECRLLTV
jgi:hypothetical protein